MADRNTKILASFLLITVVLTSVVIISYINYNDKKVVYLTFGSVPTLKTNYSIHRIEISSSTGLSYTVENGNEENVITEIVTYELFSTESSKPNGSIDWDKTVLSFSETFTFERNISNMTIGIYAYDGLNNLKYFGTNITDIYIQSNLYINGVNDTSNELVVVVEEISPLIGLFKYL